MSEGLRAHLRNVPSPTAGDCVLRELLPVARNLLQRICVLGLPARSGVVTNMATRRRSNSGQLHGNLYKREVIFARAIVQTDVPVIRKEPSMSKRIPLATAAMLPSQLIACVIAGDSRGKNLREQTPGNRADRLWNRGNPVRDLLDQSSDSIAKIYLGPNAYATDRAAQAVRNRCGTNTDALEGDAGPCTRIKIDSPRTTRPYRTRLNRGNGVKLRRPF